MQSLHPTSSAATTIEEKPKSMDNLLAVTPPVNNVNKSLVVAAPKQPVQTQSVSAATVPVSKPSELSTIVFIERESNEIQQTLMLSADNVEKGYVREKLATIREFGIVDFLVVVELAIAIFFIFSSVSLGVASSTYAWTFFLVGILIIVPLLPVVGLLGASNPKAPYVFKLLTLISGALNVFWATFALALHSTTSQSGFTLLLSVAILQFCCLGCLFCYDYNELDDEGEAPAHKQRKETPSMRSEYKSKPNKSKVAKKHKK